MRLPWPYVCMGFEDEVLLDSVWLYVTLHLITNLIFYLFANVISGINIDIVLSTNQFNLS